MNVKFLRYSLGAVAVFSTTHLYADPLPEWVSSYNANGTCYCTPSILPSLKNKIVPTPVGGQSIGQVCNRIGKGPGLVLDGGLFNYPAYHDAQCGNGPYGADPEGCEGRMEAEDTICTGSGPEWDLKAAYARPAAARPAETETSPVQSAAISTVDEEAEAQRARELAAQARARSEQEEAELARQLAEQARQKSIQQSEEAEQELARQLAEKARLRAVEEEEAADARLAQELAQKQAEPVTPSVPAESVAQTSGMSQAEQEDARIAKQLAAEARAEQERAEELKQAKARAAKAKAALAAAVDSDAADATGSRSTPTPLAEQTEAEKKAARIRAAAAKAAQLRAAEANAKKQAEEQLADSDSVSKVESAAEPSISAASGNAVRVPPGARGPATRRSYVEVAPISYDFGGAGASLGGGLMMGSNWQLTGRAAVVEEYTEVMVGIARSFVPRALNGAEINILAGLEHGNFDLGITELTDSGVILGSSLGYDLSGRANLSAGINYSSFFEGDPAVFGQLLFRVVRNLDLATRVEGGDNTNLSLGLRYHY